MYSYCHSCQDTVITYHRQSINDYSFEQTHCERKRKSLVNSKSLKTNENTHKIKKCLKKLGNIKQRRNDQITSAHIRPGVYITTYCMIKNTQRVKRALFNQTKQDRMQLVEGIFFFKATNNTKTSKSLSCYQLGSSRRTCVGD